MGVNNATRTADISKTIVAHGVTSAGRQRAIDIAAVIARVTAERKAAGARDVFVVFGKDAGTLLICERA